MSPHLLGGLLLAAAAVGVVLLIADNGDDTDDSDTVPVPGVIGADLSQARPEVEEVALEVEIVQEPSPGAGPRRVIDQEPPGGTEVVPGSTVQLVTGK